MKRKNIRRITALMVCAVMLLALGTTAFAAPRFTDVPANAWYSGDVEFAVDNGLVNGTTATTYSPDKNLTYAEAIKLAACMHKKVTQGSTDFPSGSPWYQTYVDYARTNGIIPAAKEYPWTENATRAGYMEIFASAIPDAGLLPGYSGLTAKNTVDNGTIPDVQMTHPQAGAIYKLYRAGILQGNDAQHNCSPATSIRRSEVAAILTRMMDPAKRISFEMKVETNKDKPADKDKPAELVITDQPKSVQAQAGDRVSFSVTAAGGTTPYTYTWQVSMSGGEWKNVKDAFHHGYEGADKSTVYIIAGNEDWNDNYYYRCVVTDAKGNTVKSNPANISPKKLPLTITSQPDNVRAGLYEAAVFTVTVTGGTEPYTYTWQVTSYDEEWKNVKDAFVSGYSGADTNTLLITVDQSDWDENWYRCVITDADNNTVATYSVHILEPLS